MFLLDFLGHIGSEGRSRLLDKEIDGSILVCIYMLCPTALHCIHIAPVDSTD